MQGFDELVSADEVRVIQGTGFDEKNRRHHWLLASERDATEVAQLIELVTSLTPHEPMDWMEWPAISVVLLRERRLVAELGLLDDCRWVRTAGGDRELERPDALRAWLDRHHVQMG